MTTNLISCLTLTTLIGFLSMGTIKYSGSNMLSVLDNNTITMKSTSENLRAIVEITQDTFPKKNRSKHTYKTTDDNGEKIHLSIVDGEIQKLKINGKLIPKNKYYKYSDLVEEVIDSKKDHDKSMEAHDRAMEAHDLAMEEHDRAMETHEQAIEKHRTEIERHHKEIEKQQKESELNNKTSETLINQLYEDGIIKNKEQLHFKLSKNEFIINGEKQTIENKKRYIKLYEKIIGSKIKNNFYEVTFTKGSW